MPLVPLPLGLVGCCCCCPGDRLGPPGVVAGNGNGDGAVPGFTPGEEESLASAARSWIGETGRTCGDFFRTLRLPGRADAFLAGRPTLLTLVRDLDSLQSLFLSSTVCAVVGAPPPRVTPQLRRPPSMAPTMITVIARRLDPFQIPTAVAFRGTIGEYFAWKNSQVAPIRFGFIATARNDFDGSLFDEFCLGPACP